MKKELKRIAEQRIKRLFDLAWHAFEKTPELSRRYIRLARKIGMRYNVRLPSSLKRSFCKNCNSLLVPGKTARVRVSRSQRIVTCLECMAVKRYPYRKEKQKRKI